ncbi:hypothetical protein C8F01DRAFT_1255469 [Mycena amicta]|nr:hypothetical protein C8F01DRAFT_1255469 [Mycena amicta]
MPIKVTLAKERADHITKPLSARVSALSFPGAPRPPDPETRVPPSPPSVHGASTPPLDSPPINALNYLDDLHDELDSGDDDEDRGHGLPKPPPPDSDEEGAFGSDNDEDDDLGHGPPPPRASDEESGCGTPSGSDNDNELKLSPIRKRRVTIRPDSDEEDDWGLTADTPAIASPAPSARTKTKKPVGWRKGWRSDQRVRKNRMQSISAELAAFQLKHKKKEQRLVQRLAKKYSVRVGAVETKLVGAKQWKMKRKASEKKVLTGYYCRTINAERTAAGKDKISFFTAQARVAKKPELIQFPPELKAKVMEEYAAREKLKITGKRRTALGAAKDVTVTTKKLAEDHTNTVSFSIIAPVDADNSLSVPIVLDGGGAQYMFERHGMTEIEVANDYGKWASTAGKGELFVHYQQVRANVCLSGISNMSMKELQNYCRLFVTRGLTKVAQKPTRMNYDNYCSKILAIHGVHLVGWPDECPWRSPAEIKKPIPLRALARAIEKKECYWRVVESNEDLEELEKEYTGLVSQGLRPKPTGHKTRSDKGSTRGKQTKRRKQADADESEGGAVETADSIAKNRSRRTTTKSSKHTAKPAAATTTSRRKRMHDETNDSDGHQTDGSNEDAPPKRKRGKKASDDDGRQTGKKAKRLDDSTSKRAGMPPTTSEAYRRLREQRHNAKPKPKKATVQPATETPTTQPTTRPKPKPRVKAPAPAEEGTATTTSTTTITAAQPVTQTATSTTTPRDCYNPVSNTARRLDGVTNCCGWDDPAGH